MIDSRYGTRCAVCRRAIDEFGDAQKCSQYEDATRELPVGKKEKPSWCKQCQIKKGPTYKQDKKRREKAAMSNQQAMISKEHDHADREKMKRVLRWMREDWEEDYHDDPVVDAPSPPRPANNPRMAPRPQEQISKRARVQSPETQAPRKRTSDYSLQQPTHAGSATDSLQQSQISRHQPPQFAQTSSSVASYSSTQYSSQGGCAGSGSTERPRQPPAPHYFHGYQLPASMQSQYYGPNIGQGSAYSQSNVSFNPTRARGEGRQGYAYPARSMAPSETSSMLSSTVAGHSSISGDAGSTSEYGTTGRHIGEPRRADPPPSDASNVWSQSSHTDTDVTRSAVERSIPGDLTMMRTRGGPAEWYFPVISFADYDRFEHGSKDMYKLGPGRDCYILKPERIVRHRDGSFSASNPLMRHPHYPCG
jgi:hypothetical protein